MTDRSAPAPMAPAGPIDARMVADRRAPDNTVEAPADDRQRAIRTLEARVSGRDRLIDDLRGRLTERGLFANWLQAEVELREARIGRLGDELAGRAAEVERLRGELDALRSSRRWRVGGVICGPLGRLRRVATIARRLPGSLLAGRRRVERPPVVDDAMPAVATVPDEPATTAPEPRDRNAVLGLLPPRADRYGEWVRNNAWDAAAEAEARHLLDALPGRPRFAVVVDAAGVGPAELREMIAGLRMQVYPERFVRVVWAPAAVAASAGGDVRGIDADPSDPIGRLSEVAREAAREADYLLLLDGRARLSPDALLMMAREATQTAGSPVLISADEDRVDPTGRRFGPQFKPSWSPERLLSGPYLGRSFVIRGDVFEAIGGIDPTAGEAWAYDLALRLTERPGRVAHVPRVLFHVAGDGPDDVAPAGSIEAHAEALRRAVDRRGIVAGVNRPDWAVRRRSLDYALDFPDDGPRVAIVIPTRDRVDLLRRCVASVLERTAYRNFEVIILDDGSSESRTLDYLDHPPDRCRVVRTGRSGGKFNYARMHNEAIAQLDEGVEHIVLLNNDTEVRRAEWLSQLVGYAGIEGVGAVGARLLFGDGRVQHAGITVGLHGHLPNHGMRLAPWWDGGDGEPARTARNVAAVTAACLLIRRSLYLELGGFDAERFAVGYNDVDLCLRLGEHGFRSVYAPRAELLHLEGASRGVLDDPAEARRYRDRWGDALDPSLHPTVAPRDDRFGLSTRRRLRDGGDGPAPRVLCCVDRLGRSGRSRFLGDLAIALEAKGLVRPVVLAAHDGPIGNDLRARGIPVLVEEAGLDPLERIGRLADRIEEERPDAVHAVGLDGFLAVRAARLAGVPALWSLREAIDFRDAFGVLDEPAAAEAIAAYADAYRIVFPAHGVRHLHQPAETRWNFEVIHEGARSARPALANRDAARRRLGLPGDAVVVACLDDDPGRGLRDLATAVAALVRRGIDAVVLVADVDGKASEAAWTLGDRLVPIGSPGGESLALGAADLVVCGDPRDLSPRALMLAQEAGLPIVAARVAGVDEYVRPGQTALVYPPGDPDSLREQITAVLRDEGLRRSLAGAGPLAAGLLPDFDRAVAEYASLYREAVAVGSVKVGNHPLVDLERLAAA